MSSNIYDAIHGVIELTPIMEELIEIPEFQRLRGIKQLGITNLVFPGANHTRFEHSLGVGHLARKICNNLNLERDEENLIVAAALLHDIGHGPYSHTLEKILIEKKGYGHTEISKQMITGNIKQDSETIRDKPRISDILKKYNLESEKVAELVTGDSERDEFVLFFKEKQSFYNGPAYRTQIVHSAIDADRMDYLLRDSYYTGVALGTIDVARIMQSFRIHNNDLVIHKNCIPALEGMLVARTLMYSAVYNHKTARIGQLMIERAVEVIENFEIEEIQKLTDDEFDQLLRSMGGFQKEILNRIKYRKLYKTAIKIKSEEIDDENKEIFLEMCEKEGRKNMESKIARMVGVEPREIIIDIPKPEIIKNKKNNRFSKIPIFDEGKVRSIRNYSEIIRSLEVKEKIPWAIAIICPENYREKIATKVEDILF